MLHKFAAFALAPLLYNLGIIAGAVFFYPAFGIIGLGFGVVLGAFLHFFVHFFVSSRNGFVLGLSLSPSLRDIGEVLRVSFPRTIGLSANQIALFALVAFAARMEHGSVTVFNFALNLQSVPLAIIGVSYATAAFPALSKHFASDDTEKFLAQILSAARHIIFWSLPVLVLFIGLRAQIVRSILGSGSFDWTATKLTAACLAIFTVSIVAQSIGLLFVRGFYATGNNSVPLLTNVLSAVLIILGGYGFMFWYAHMPTFRYFIESLLRVEGVSGTGVLCSLWRTQWGCSSTPRSSFIFFAGGSDGFCGPSKTPSFMDHLRRLSRDLWRMNFWKFSDYTSTSIRLWEFLRRGWWRGSRDS
jgi:murein biosynthesis integral membrane protein MurJ